MIGIPSVGRILITSGAVGSEGGQRILWNLVEMVRSIVLCLALLPAVAALVQQSYPASISISPPRAAPLRLRGGLCDIDPNLVAKVTPPMAACSCLSMSGNKI